MNTFGMKNPQVLTPKVGPKGLAPLVADLFLFCYERDFMMSLSIIASLFSFTQYTLPT